MTPYADMAELVDAQDLGSCTKSVQVRFLLSAPLELSIADTKVLAIFSFIGKNNSNITDL